MSGQPDDVPESCIATEINHICIAVRDIEGTLGLYRNLFGINGTEVEEVPDQGVKAAMVQIGGSQLEFIAPTDPDGGVARFIERNGEGLHHICFEVEDIQGKLDLLDSKEVQLVDRSPRQGLAGMIAFLHPRATGGVLIELVDRDTVGR